MAVAATKFSRRPDELGRGYGRRMPCVWQASKLHELCVDDVGVPYRQNRDERLQRTTARDMKCKKTLCNCARLLISTGQIWLKATFGQEH